MSFDENTPERRELDSDSGVPIPPPVPLFRSDSLFGDDDPDERAAPGRRVRRSDASAETGPPDLTAFWANPRHGARKRVAHYLYVKVGEGQVFSQERIRDAIRDEDGRGINQIDRRRRELNEVGWIIRNYKDMATLAPDELYLEKIGDHIWEPGYRPIRSTTLSANDRRTVYETEGRRCAVCGIDFGDEYPHLALEGKHVKARPTIGHWTPKERGGTDELSNLRPECHLCNEQSRNLTGPPVDVGLVKRKVRELRRDDKRLLTTWLLSGRRSFSDVEVLWGKINQLPASGRDDIKKLLGEMLGE